MKRIVFVCLIAGSFVGCNTTQPSKMVEMPVASKDSLVRQLQVKDSSITDYVKSINDIQKGIDTLMLDARVLKMHGEGVPNKNSVVEELRVIGKLMLKNQKDLAVLQRKLKTSGQQNQDLVDLGEELSKQLNERDSEIAAIQKTLFKTKASLESTVQQLNDSINVIIQQRAQINILQIKGNTVYYRIATEKILKNEGTIMENGGAIGLGKVPIPGPDMNTSGFVSGDLNKLHDIDLNGHFVRMVTPHSSNSYRIVPGASDKLIITDPEDFWNKSKYLIVIVK